MEHPDPPSRPFDTPMFVDNAPFVSLPHATLGRAKILLVDDQPINIQVLHQIFATDFQVFMATDAQQALAVCRTNPPDLVLLDIMMPGMDGFELCTQLKADEHCRDIPVIFVTAHTDTEQETHGLEVGAVDFISKPVNPAVVRARVKTHITLKLQSDVMRKLVFLDGLTGVYNRRYFDQQLRIEWARSLRSGKPLSLILLDVDFFKHYNDLYGHLMGDDCLRQIALCLKEGMRRPADLVARYGGEEFACILPETGLEDAWAIAHALEQRVRARHIAHANSEVAPQVTISLGVAGTVPTSGADETGAQALLAQADAQLYRAKNAGRGQACSAYF